MIDGMLLFTGTLVLDIRLLKFGNREIEKSKNWYDLETNEQPSAISHHLEGIIVE